MVLLALTVFGTCPLAATSVDPIFRGSWPGFPRGVAECVAIDGDVAYVGLDAGLMVFDISDPGNPERIGGYDGATPVRSVVTSDQKALLLTDRELVIIDIADPAKPARMGSYVTDDWDTWYPHSLAVQGDYAFLATRNGLLIVDCADPADPQLAGDYATGWLVMDVGVSGSHAYLVGGQYVAATLYRDSLIVLDVEEPSSPTPVARRDSNMHARSIAISDNMACVVGTKRETQGGQWRSSLHLIDISQPADPVPLGQFDAQYSAPSPKQVCVAGNLAYVAGSGWQGEVGSETLLLIDISDTQSPLQVGACELGVTATGVAVSNGHAYVTGGDLQVVDVTVPSDPQLASEYKTEGWTLSVAVSGDHVYLNEWDTIEVLDISNPENPSRVGRVAGDNWIPTFAISDSFAYLAMTTLDSAMDALTVLDVSSPDTLREVGRLEYPEFEVTALAVEGKHVCGAAGGGFRVFDVSEPSSPRVVGTCSWLSPTRHGRATEVLTSGELALVTFDQSWDGPPADPGWLFVVDISDRTKPQRIGEYRTEGVVDASRAAVSGHYAFLAAAWDLEVIDLSEPSNPCRVVTYRPGGNWYVADVATWGHYAALVTWDNGGVQVLDISDPVNPTLLGSFPGITGGQLAFQQGNIYVAGGRNGLAILQMPPFINSISRSGQGMKLNWETFGQSMRLQRTIWLTNPDWQDLIGSEGLNEITLPQWSGSEFFRLARP